MQDTRKTPPGKFSWSSIRPKLYWLFDSASPHVRSNLATLAATMAPDAGALEELAKIGVEAVVARINNRDGAPEVLRTVIQERQALQAAVQSEFDRIFLKGLEKEQAGWPAEALAALLRENVPIDLIPVDYLVREIFDICGRVPIDARSTHDIDVLQKQRERIEVIREAAEHGLESFRSQLTRVAAEKLHAAQQIERRNALMFGLLELWPELARATSREKVNSRRINLVPAATMGRTHFFRLAGPVIGAIVLAVLCFYVVPRASTAFLRGNLSEEGFDKGLAIAGYGLALSAMVFASILPAIFLYTPNSTLRLKPWTQLQINFPAILFTALVLSACFSVVSYNLEGGDFKIEWAGIVFGLSVLGGLTTSMLLPLLVRFERRLNRYWPMLNPFTLAAPQLLLSMGLLAWAQLPSVTEAALVWAFVMIGGVGFSSVVWLGEKRRARWRDNEKTPRKYVSYVALMLVTSVILITTLGKPVAMLLYSAMVPSDVELNAKSKQVDAISGGRVYRVSSDRPFSIEVQHEARYSLEHIVSIKAPKSAHWEAENSKSSSAPDDKRADGLYVSALAVADEGQSLICYDCFQGGGHFGDFAEIGWPFRKTDKTSVRVVRGVKDGDILPFGKYFSLKVDSLACIYADSKAKMWSVIGNEYQRQYYESMGGFSEFEIFPSDNNSSDCDGSVNQLHEGGYQICLYNYEDEYGKSCDREFAFPKGSTSNGSAKISIVPAKKEKQGEDISVSPF